MGLQCLTALPDLPGWIVVTAVWPHHLHHFTHEVFSLCVTFLLVLLQESQSYSIICSLHLQFWSTVCTSVDSSPHSILSRKKAVELALSFLTEWISFLKCVKKHAVKKMPEMQQSLREKHLPKLQSWSCNNRIRLHLKLQRVNTSEEVYTVTEVMQYTYQIKCNMCNHSKSSDTLPPSHPLTSPSNTQQHNTGLNAHQTRLSNETVKGALVKAHSRTQCSHMSLPHTHANVVGKEYYIGCPSMTEAGLMMC